MERRTSNSEVRLSLDFIQRESALAKVLYQDLRPLNISFLDCIGCLDLDLDRINVRYTGYVFQLPSPTISPNSHQDLHQVLSAPLPVPTWSERFELANILAATLFEIHSLRWLHKDISSGNVVFWHKSEDLKALDFSRSYLIGLKSSLPPYESTWHTELWYLRSKLRYYKHPRARESLEGDKFQRSHDLYSLGILLAEIGYWQTLPNVFSLHNAKRLGMAQEPSELKLTSESLAIIIQDLGKYMGSRYAHAVKACLEGELGGDGDATFTSPYYAQYIESFQSDIVDVS